MKDSLDVKSIKEFIGANRLPLVTEFNKETSSKIFGGDIKSHVLLFLSNASDAFQDQLDLYKTVAAEFKGKVNLSICGILNTHEHACIHAHHTQNCLIVYTIFLKV